MASKKTLYLFLDTEATGLNFNQDGTERENKLLEVAYILTQSNRKLRKLTEGHYIVQHKVEDIKPLMDSYVLDLHSKNGLIGDIESGKGIPLQQVDELICQEIKHYAQEDDVRIILAGNSIHFDKELIRRTLPKVYSLLYYRVLDVSSVREVFSMTIGNHSTQYANNKKCVHRAMDDIIESMNELKIYQKRLKSRFR